MQNPDARRRSPGNPGVDYEALFEALPGLHLALTREGRVEAASGAFLERIGKDRTEVLGTKLPELLDTDAEEDLGTFLERIARSSGPGELPVRFRVEAPGKAPGICRLRAMPVLDARGSLRHLLATVEGGPVRETRSPAPVLPGQWECNPSGPLESPLILVVEDNPVMNEFVRSTLSEKYRVAVAFDADEGLRKSCENTPDLVISDLSASPWNSETFIRSLRQRRQFESVPIIVLAARADAELVLRLLREGVQDYIEKPVPASELCAKVDRLLAYRKKAMEEIRLSEERFRLLADSAPVLIWIGDRSKGCTWFNRSWLEYVGRGMEEEIGAGWIDGVHPDDRERVRSQHGEAFAEGKPFRIEFRLRGSDAQYRWMLDHGVPIGGEGGDVTGFIGSCIDIHDRKRTEEQRELLLSWERFGREEAERSSRMKDEFLATISHELRTPLQAILGWSRLLQTGSLPSEEVSQGLEIIERNARAQTRIIEDLLETSRIISGKVRLEVDEIDLGTLIEAAVDSVRPAAAAKGIALELDLDPSARRTSGDANRLQQVFWNLLSNSIKFTPAGGSVEVSLGGSGRNVEICVTDTGAGIRPEFLDHIFERFRQADSSTTRRHRGLGLGLAIVRHIVELHGGVVRAASEGEGKGSTFTVTLPRRTARPESGAQDKAGEKAAERPLDPGYITLRGLKLLVVDDEADALEIVRRVLEKHEAQVATADSTNKALEIFSGYKPDALISDIGMPERDGYDLLRSIRSLSPEMGGKVPALALTALTRSEDRQRAFSAGYQMHISKPVEPAELVSAVAKLAGREARRN